MIKSRILISGGGTGGHIYPAISIAEKLIEANKDFEILFVGARNKMEMKIIPKFGYKILGLWISGLNRNFFNFKSIIKNIFLPIKLLISIFQSILIVHRFKPNIVIGTGGYASAPVLFSANILQIKTVIQEQNSYPGITNKILSSKASKIFVAYENMHNFFPKQKLIFSGNPVRSNINSKKDGYEKALKYFDLNKNCKTLFIIGGSLGSKEINNSIFSILDYLDFLNLQVIWQCGKIYYDEYKSKVNSENIRLFDFIHNIDLAYQAADFIISRSGASVISELCIIGKPVIFIPSPNVAENHQLRNAQAIAEKQAAILIQEKDLKNSLKKQINNLNSSSDLRNRLSKNIKKLAKVNATTLIVDEIKKILNQ